MPIVRFSISPRLTPLICLLILLLLAQHLVAVPVKNVILMVVDGAGFNMFNSASFYQHGDLGYQPYDSFPARFGCTTYSLDKNGDPQGYDPKKAWSSFKYLKTATDSAAAGTALNTGEKTTNGRIAADKDGNFLITFAQYADSLGKATGAVSSVQISHATPAAVWSHNTSRYNYQQIANEMILRSGLDVIMGCGHPAYDNSNKLLPQEKWKPEFIGGSITYNALINAQTDPVWKFIDTKFDFLLLANDPAPLTDRVIGIARCSETLQLKRDSKLNENVPDLPTMARAALNVLNKDPDGFYIMIEGGAVDWANHASDLTGAIEEMIDFNNAVQAVVKWVWQNSNWDETLLIVTSDHETGQIWGPDAGKKGTDHFQLPTNNGKGVYPSSKYFHGGHTNVLVPLFAIGNGSEMFAELVDGTDAGAAKAWNFSGKYVDNTDVFNVMQNAAKKK